MIAEIRKLIYRLAPSILITSLASLLILFNFRDLSQIVVRNRLLVDYNQLLASPSAVNTRMFGDVSRETDDSCVQANLLEFELRQQEAFQMWKRSDRLCQKISLIGEAPKTLAFTTIGPSVEVLDQDYQRLYFRRNDSVWTGIYVSQLGFYELEVTATGSGPGTALLELEVNDRVRMFQFSNATRSKSVILELSAGFHPIMLSFVNDYAGQGGDRNLEVAGVNMRLVTDD